MHASAAGPPGAGRAAPPAAGRHRPRRHAAALGRHGVGSDRGRAARRAGRGHPHGARHRASPALARRAGRTSSATAASPCAATARSSTTCDPHGPVPARVRADGRGRHRRRPAPGAAGGRVRGRAGQRVRAGGRLPQPAPRAGRRRSRAGRRGVEASSVGKLLGRHPDLAEGEFLARVQEVVGDRGIVAYSGAGGLAEISRPGRDQGRRARGVVRRPRHHGPLTSGRSATCPTTCR